MFSYLTATFHILTHFHFREVQLTKMGVNVCVPCNFDVENRFDQFQGNIDIVFSDESKMKASSLILLWKYGTVQISVNSSMNSNS